MNQDASSVRQNTSSDTELTDRITNHVSTVNYV